MDKTLQKALYIILISAGLAVIFNYLFFGKLIGVSLLVFAVLFLGTVFLFAQRYNLALKKIWWLVALIIFFALMPSIRANMVLNFLNICATFGLMMLLGHQLVGTPSWVMKLRDYIVLAVLVPLRMLAGALSTISLLGQIHSKVQNRDVWLRIAKGVILAIPILLLFGILFSQADLAFSQFLKEIVDINISQRTVQYAVWLLLSFAATLGFLSYVFLPKQTELVVPAQQPDPTEHPGKGIEVLVFLGLIATLFILFIGFQVAYLFGGESNIISAGFTYAEYARRGFWELLVVALFSLLILFAAEKYAGAVSKKDWRFLAPALVLIAEVILIMISALKRLWLYIDAYSLTEDRFYVAVIIFLLFGLFILLAIKFIRSRPEQFFTFGALISMVTALAVVNIINPHAIIIRSNIERYDRTGNVDVYYTRDLSADAKLGKMELYGKLHDSEKDLMRDLLQVERDNLERYNNNWQTANLSRAKGLRLLNHLWE